MLPEAFRQVDEWEMKYKMEPEENKLAERIEDAMRKVLMAERLQGMGTDTPVGDDDSFWKTLPLLDVKLGEVHPLTGRKRQPWERKTQPSFWMACTYCQLGMGACAAFPSRRASLQASA